VYVNGGMRYELKDLVKRRYFMLGDIGIQINQKRLWRKDI
jgi:hypothetical protein